MVSLEFFIDIILPATLWLWGRLSLLTGEQHLGGKSGRCERLTILPPSCANCLELLGASNAYSPKDMSKPAMRQLYLHLHQENKAI
jgi:hypothetical protein